MVMTCLGMERLWHCLNDIINHHSTFKDSNISGQQSSILLQKKSPFPSEELLAKITEMQLLERRTG
jgi:hypothetical protein